MAVAFSICIAVLVTLGIFFRELKSTDQSPIIFLLSLTLLVILCSLTGVTPMPFTKGPAGLVVIGGVMLMLLGGNNTFKVLVKMPASAYKALAPAAICVGVLLLLGLTLVF